jgi:hypothetical protein
MTQIEEELFTKLSTHHVLMSTLKATLKEDSPRIKSQVEVLQEVIDDLSEFLNSNIDKNSEVFKETTQLLKEDDDFINGLI